jgi:hypothetical protein
MVADVPPDASEYLNRWLAEWDRLCNDDDDSSDEQRLQAALDEAKAQAKAFVKHQMGLE